MEVHILCLGTSALKKVQAACRSFLTWEWKNDFTLDTIICINKHFNFNLWRHFFIQQIIMYILGQVQCCALIMKPMYTACIKKLQMLGMLFNTNSRQKVYNINKPWGMSSNTRCWTSNNLFWWGQWHFSHDVTLTMLSVILCCCISHFMSHCCCCCLPAHFGSGSSFTICWLILAHAASFWILLIILLWWLSLQINCYRKTG